MVQLNDLNIVTMTQAFSDNKDRIQLYLSNPEMFAEDTDSVKDASILGMAIGIFIFVYLLVFIIFAWSLYALIRYWSHIPNWAKVVSILFLFVFPLFSLVIIYGTMDIDNDIYIRVTPKKSKSPRKSASK